MMMMIIIIIIIICNNIYAHRICAGGWCQLPVPPYWWAKIIILSIAGSLSTSC